VLMCISYGYGIGASFTNVVRIDGLRLHMLHVLHVAYVCLHEPITRYTLITMLGNHYNTRESYNVAFKPEYARFMFTGPMHPHWLVYGGACDMLCHLLAMKEHQFASMCN